VVAGNFGSPDRLEFTVLGDTVNVAARLETMADPGTILVGPGTFERASHAFAFRTLGPRPVRGRSQNVDVWQVTGPLGA
jgi:adenylate cyclase